MPILIIARVMTAWCSSKLKSSIGLTP